jgi:hypothetical protein
MADIGHWKHLEPITGTIWEVNSVLRFHNCWAHHGVLASLLAKVAERDDHDEFKVIDTTHIKVHQDACRHPQSPELRGLGKIKGGRNSKLNACVNGNGKALFILLRPGNEHEIVTTNMDKVVLADRGYDSDKFRDHVSAHGGIAMIPGKKTGRSVVPSNRNRQTQTGGGKFLRQNQAAPPGKHAI